MDMNVNCTLLVQCLNFGIAYLILSRLIFKPVLECIMEEREKRQALQKSIVSSQGILDKLETERQSSWKKAQSAFSAYLQKIPTSQRRMPFEYGYKYESATDEQVDVHVQHMHDAIMKKVEDDFK